jgi:3-hydroxymyristoyl/3-hydroxydecanoyl-(acyl carrier protein) dehydratase
MPVVPGVVQLDWVVALASKWLGGSPCLARIDALKFKSLIRPGARLTLTLERDVAARAIRFRLASRDEVHAVGRLVLAEASDRT